MSRAEISLYSGLCLEEEDEEEPPMLDEYCSCLGDMPPMCGKNMIAAPCPPIGGNYPISMGNQSKKLMTLVKKKVQVLLAMIARICFKVFHFFSSMAIF